MTKQQLAVIACAVTVLIFSCRRDSETLENIVPVNDTAVRFELDEVPYSKLSDYLFYLGELKNMEPNVRVLPYEPITPLFSDYAHKSRFIWMPEGVSATYVDDYSVLNFPDGTVMIKNFYYDNVQPEGNRQILETRLIYKKDGHWEFADYTWNEEQTEATFDLEGSYVPLDWMDDSGVTKSVVFRIPAEAECFTCHKKAGQNIPIGPKPQNLNKEYDYPEGGMNQLEKWKEVGYLSGDIPTDIVTTADWEDTSQSLKTRVRSYLDANCSHCHSADGHCYYRPLRFSFSETTNDDNLGICKAPEEFINETLTHVIARGNINRSVMHFRLSTIDQQYRMPLLGRTLVHEEGLAMIEEYINSLSPNCE